MRKRILSAEENRLQRLQKNWGWKEYGEYYGYPKCCIESFCRGDFGIGRQDSIHRSYGFIPCDECAKKILSGETTLEKLIKNRVCEIKFPNG